MSVECPVVLLLQMVQELYLFQIGYAISLDFSKVGLQLNRLIKSVFGLAEF